MKQKIIQMSQMLDKITNSELPFFQIKDDDDNVLYEGITIFYLLKEYAARYMIADSVDDIFFKWSNYNAYKKADFLRAYNALFAEYNPLNNYDMSEKSIDLTNHGETDKTRSTADGHKTVSTSNKYDYSTSTEADSNNLPTTRNYTTTYDDDTDGRLASYSTQAGKTTARTTADADKNETVVTDDLTVVNSETHTPTTMTVDDTTYTADNINAHEMQRAGNIGVTSSQMLIQSEIEVRKRSLIYDYVYDFICRYTFYAAGGECYDYYIENNN